MIAHYTCDRCGYKMKPADHERIKVEFEGVLVEIISGWKNVWNGGHICHRCVRAAVKHGRTHGKSR